MAGESEEFLVQETGTAGEVNKKCAGFSIFLFLPN